MKTNHYPAVRSSATLIFGKIPLLIPQWLVCGLFSLLSLPLFSQTYPTGFSQVPVATGISNPTVMAFAPDGRIFVAEQGGKLRVIKNGSLLATPFIQLSVNSSGERGLIGIALDPNFSTNGYIYLYHTLSDASRNRITRFTASGDVALTGSDVVILNLDPLSSATNHNGGAMHFGKDGKLYVAVGENANTSHAQNLDTYHGKILRINPDGSVPAGNPFTSGTAQKQRVWAYGLRNPYTIDVQPGTGTLYVNDVGQNTWEEINDATTGGKNFGWPSAEGVSSNSAYANPVFTYQHGSGDGKGCAITGGVFFNPTSTNYPAEYVGRYFYQDYCNNWINMISLGGSVTRFPFATSLPGSSLAIDVGTDGNLYYLSRNNGALYKIVYNPPATPPAISQQPANVTVSAGQSASFTVAATGTQPLSYQWQKDGVNISGATAATYTISNVTTASAGTYRVVVTNSAGSATSNGATLTVTAANGAPTATIVTPAEGTLYSGSETISFSGTATDPEDGTLPASAFSWSVVFHHDTHTHDGPPVATGVTSGTFTIPNSGEVSANVWYRLFLTVTDSQGQATTIYRDIYPRKSTISLATNPAGLQVTLDGQPVTASVSVESVEGILRTLGAPSPQTVNGVTYEFVSWSQGGNASQTITTPVDNVTYTANFSVALRNPENPASTAAGVDYSYYEGDWNALPDFSTLTPVKSGQATDFSLAPRNRNDYFGFMFTGYIQVPTDGVYTFYTSSDDGSKLLIGSTLVVNNDGLHGTQEQSGSIGLKAGKHAVTVTFFEKTGGEVLGVSWAGPGITKQAIPASALFRAATSSALAVKINFQPATSPVPAGYLADVGAVYADRGNGYSYGWNAATNETRDRQNASVTDQRYNTLNHLQKPSNPNAIWEIGLPNGTYKVDLTGGDPNHTDQINTFDVEGTILTDPDGQDNFDAYSTTVTVSDGRLTIKSASGSSNAKLNFVDIAQVSAAAAAARTASATEAGDKLKVFPNPVQDAFTVTYEAREPEMVQVVLSEVGSRTFSQSVRFARPGANDFQVQAGGLPSGTYLVSVRNGKRVLVEKVVVRK